MTTEPTNAPAPDGGTAAPETAPVAPVTPDLVDQGKIDAVLAKYGGDSRALGQGYYNSTQEFQKYRDERVAEQQAMSSERAAWVAKEAAWDAERTEHTAKVESIEGSQTSALQELGTIQTELQLFRARDEEVSEEFYQRLTDAGMSKTDQKLFVQANNNLVDAHFEEAQPFAPEGTAIGTLLAFMNSDAVEGDPDKSVFTVTEHAFLKEAAMSGDYATAVPLIEKKYLAWMAANDPKKDIPKGQEQRDKAKNFAPAKRGAKEGGYATPDEYNKDKNSKEYRINPIFRQEVEAKRNLSNFTQHFMDQAFGGWDGTEATIRKA